MGRPYGLLRAGYPFLKTLGMRRITNYPNDVAIGGEGRVYILCRSEGQADIRVWSFDDAERLTDDLIGIGGYGSDEGKYTWPVNIILDAEENLYVSDALNHRVQKFTNDGEFISSWGSHGDGPGQFDMPWGVTIDELGDVYVVDWRNDRLQKFTADGEFIFQVGSSGSGDSQFNRPSGVAVDKHGDIYVADTGNNRVLLFNEDGKYVQRFLGDATLSRVARDYMLTNAYPNRLRDMAVLERERYFLSPRSVRIDDGLMYVADYGRYRVQVYKNEAIPLNEQQIAAPMRAPSLSTV